MGTPASWKLEKTKLCFKERKEKVRESQVQNQRPLVWKEADVSDLCLNFLCEEANTRLTYQRTVLSAKIAKLPVSSEQSACLTSLLDSEDRAEVYHQT